MSSPLAASKKNISKKALICIHQKLSHSHRTEILSRKIFDYIDNIFPNTERLCCLDVGCGDMQIVEHINRYNPNMAWICLDIHDLPENLRENIKWAKYQKFDGVHIPFGDKSVDVALFCDMLHHAMDNAPNLLREAARVSRSVIIKDHFEYSIYSRTMLKAMDFIGNWGYGIEIPRRYLTIKGFEELCCSAGLVLKRLDIGIDLYAHLPVLRYLLRPEWHFIAVLEP